MRTLAVDYAKHGIRVNAVVPGATDTPLTWAGRSEAEKATLRETLSGEIPLGRLADPDEPAEAVLWLLSEQSRYVTGSDLVCDGGILAKASISA
jgi:NAD(P)-dependent dehydrogenase (short-subunit alcohol dehydrogenase family)